MTSPAPDQKEFIAQVRDATGLTLDQLAEKIGVAGRTLLRAFYRDINLTDRNRKALQSLVSKYRDGRPLLGDEIRHGTHVAGVLADPAGQSYGARGRLRAARESAGLTPEQLAKKVGADASYVRNLESGAPIQERFAKKIAAVLSIDVEELLGGSDSPREIDESGATGTFGAEPNIDLPAGMRARLVPLLSHAQAGAMRGTWVDEAYTYTGVLAPNLPRGARAFAVEVRGDSMVPKYSDGDLVIALWGVAPRQGEDVLACLEGGEVVCKIFSSRNRGEEIVLSSYNLAHEPIIRSREEVQWIYPVDGSYRKNRRA